MSFRWCVVVVAGVAGLMLPGSANTAVAQPDPGSRFTPVTPVRVLDTRDGTGGVLGPIGSRGSIALDLATRVPASATAVVLTVTGTSPTALTYLTVYPAGPVRPPTSNLNLVAGQTRANEVTVAMGPNHLVIVENDAGSTHVIVDLTGYYSVPTGSLFTPINPHRVLDTRNTGTPIGPNSTLDVTLTGQVPATASAVTINLTAIAGANATYLTARRDRNSLPPATSNLNLAPDDVAAAQVTVTLGSAALIVLYNNAGTTNVIVDLVGYYSDTGQAYHPVTPQRISDTRPGGGVTPDRIGQQPFPEPVPTNATAVVTNLTGTNPTEDTYIQIWSRTGPQPNTSTLNLKPGQTAANLVTTAIGDPFPRTPSLLYTTAHGYVDVIFDLSGYFAP